jgi:hypothetical protein
VRDEALLWRDYSCVQGDNQPWGTPPLRLESIELAGENAGLVSQGSLVSLG